MIFLSKKLVRLIEFCINSAYFFRVAPFKWDPVEERAYYVQTSKWNLYKWGIIKYIILSYQVLILFLYCHSLYNINDCEHFYCSTIYVLEGLYLVSCSILSIIQIILMHQSCQILNTVNGFLKHVKDLQGTYAEIKLQSILQL